MNFRDPSGYFLAQAFEMRNKDVIYVSNAIAVETTKFLNYLQDDHGDRKRPNHLCHQRLRFEGGV